MNRNEESEITTGTGWTFDETLWSVQQWTVWTLPFIILTTGVWWGGGPCIILNQNKIDNIIVTPNKKINRWVNIENRNWSEWEGVLLVSFLKAINTWQVHIFLHFFIQFSIRKCYFYYWNTVREIENTMDDGYTIK